MRLAARRDSNELILVHTAREMGARMIYIGPLDWWCGWRGGWYPVEIKTPKGRYTDFQKKFMAQCKTDRLPVWTWITLEDVMNCLQRAEIRD